MHTVNYKVYNVPYRVYCLHFTLKSLTCTLYRLQYTVYSVQCTLYIVQCTVYPMQRPSDWMVISAIQSVARRLFCCQAFNALYCPSLHYITALYWIQFTVKHCTVLHSTRATLHLTTLTLTLHPSSICCRPRHLKVSWQPPKSLLRNLLVFGNIHERSLTNVWNSPKKKQKPS